MKYVIEIEDEAFFRGSALYGQDTLFRAKGFKSLVFDENGLKKLTPLDDVIEKAVNKAIENISNTRTNCRHNSDDKINVGDEIQDYDEIKCVVIDICGDEYTVYNENGCVETVYDIEYYTKTGRHFEEVAKMLKKLQENRYGKS